MGAHQSCSETPRVASNLVRTRDSFNQDGVEFIEDDSIVPNQPVAITVRMVNVKNKTLNTMVTQNKVFSMPRRAVKIPPVSAPVNPPRPAPLLCKTTLMIRAVEVIMRAIFRNASIKSSKRDNLHLAKRLYLPPGK